MQGPEGRSRGLRDVLTALTLPTTRSLLRSPGRRLLTTAIATLYLFIAMVLGEMLVFIQTGSGYLLITIPSSLAPQNWAYPAVEVVAPGLVVVLPVLATLTMLIVAICVGIGMSAALVLAGGWVRQRRSKVIRSSGATSLVAGLTPVMLGFLTLGACCSTALAGAAGAGALTSAGAASGNPLFTDPWALSIFQIGTMWVALLAQEYLFRIYVGTLATAASRGAPSAEAAGPTTPDLPPEAASPTPEDGSPRESPA